MQTIQYRLCDMEKLYYIICKRHMNKNDYAILFWQANSQGYTYNINNAGIYDEKAIKIISKENYCDDIPVLCESIDNITIRSVIDNRTLGKVVVNNNINRRICNIKLCELLKGPSIWDKKAFCTPERFLALNEETISLIGQIRKTKSITN